MENFLLLMPTRHHPMITFLRNPWKPFILSPLVLAMLMGVSGCKQTRDETWYCYDTQGHPVEGVLIVCRYSLANSGRAAINHRFSDGTGKIVIDLDEDTPDGLQRGYSCIYSPKLKSGDAGLGGRWHKGLPIPDKAVYFDEWNNKIYLKRGVDDPLIWHNALCVLISSYSGLRGNPYGGAKLDAKLSVLVPRERALFLEKYGEQVVPLDYLKRGSFSAYYPNLDKSYTAGLKFKDITLPLPKP